MDDKKDIYTAAEARKPDQEKPIVDLTMAEAVYRTRRAVLIFLVVVVVLLGGIVGLVLFGKKAESPLIVDGEVEAVVTSKVPSLQSDSVLPESIEAMQYETADSLIVADERMDPKQMAEAMGQMRLARERIAERNWDLAEDHIRKALKISPNMVQALRLLGVVYTQRGQFDQAIVVLEQAQQIDPFSVETMNNLATAYMQTGHMDRAEELLLASLEMSPDYVISCLNLGLLYLAGNEYDLAVEYMERGLEQVPGDVNVRNNLAVAQLRLGRYQQAREQLQLIVDQKPDMSPAYFNMAITYALEGNVDQAVQWMEDGGETCAPSLFRRFLSDPDFDSIRNDPQFQRIWTQLNPAGAVMNLPEPE